jgi:hypothetical protein
MFIDYLFWCIAAPLIAKGSSVSTYLFLHKPQLLLLKSPGLANHVGGKGLGPKFSHAVFGSLIVMCNPPELHKLR